MVIQAGSNVKHSLLVLVGGIAGGFIVISCFPPSSPPPEMIGFRFNIQKYEVDSSASFEGDAIIADHMADPTPFSPYTCIEVYLHDTSRVVVTVSGFAYEGTKLDSDTIANDTLPAGCYRIRWPSDFDPPNGFYKHRVVIGSCAHESDYFSYSWHGI